MDGRQWSAAEWYNLDLGEYRLLHTYEAQKLNNTAKIYAVEPDPRNIKVLSKNLELTILKQSSIKQCAISSQNGIAKFDFTKDKFK